MAYLDDLTGKKYNRLIVIQRAPDHISPSGRKRVKWLCQCECGKQIEVFGDNLKSNKTQSCGCLNQENRIKNFKDISNQRFGNLLAIKPTNLRNKSGEIIWECLCDCGKTHNVSLGDLRSGDVKSCGCNKNKSISESLTTDLIGQTFGFLTVKNKIYKKNTYQHLWECECRCGKKIFLNTNQLHTQLSCGCSTRSKGEQKIYDILESNNINFTVEKSFDDCLNKDNTKKLRFDFAIFDNNNKIKCLIEYQGEQHYFANDFFDKNDNLEKRQEKDQIKRDYCLKNNIKLIEIPYTDFSKLDWGYLNEKIEQ